jgi:hypothetical protein
MNNPYARIGNGPRSISPSGGLGMELSMTTGPTRFGEQL